MIESGLASLEGDEDQKRVIIALQQRAISFRALAEYFGPDLTLGQLAETEKEYA